MCCGKGEQPCTGDEADYCCPPNYSCISTPENPPGPYTGFTCCPPGTTGCHANFPPVQCCKSGTTCVIRQQQAYCGAPVRPSDFCSSAATRTRWVASRL